MTTTTTTIPTITFNSMPGPRIRPLVLDAAAAPMYVVAACFEKAGAITRLAVYEHSSCTVLDLPGSGPSYDCQYVIKH